MCKIIARLNLLKIPARREGSSSETLTAVKLLEFRVPCLWRVTFLCRVETVTADDLIPMYVQEALVGLKCTLVELIKAIEVLPQFSKIINLDRLNLQFKSVPKV